MKSKLVRGQNLFEVSLWGISKCDYKDAQGNFVLVKGKKYEIIGIYYYEEQIPELFIIKEHYSFELFHKEDFDLIEIKSEQTVDNE